MMRMPKLVQASLMVLLCFVGVNHLYADTVLFNTDYTTPGIHDGDLTLVNGSLVVSVPGDVVINGDLKIESGSVFMAPGSGSLRVLGDVIITNTLPSGNASIIAHGPIEVTGAIITKSTYGDANITTSGASVTAPISAESITTRAATNASVWSHDNIAVVAEINTQSTAASAFVKGDSAGVVSAGSIVTDGYVDGYITGSSISVLGNITTLGLNGDGYVFAIFGPLYAGSITTKSYTSGAVIATNSSIDVKGIISTNSSGYANVQSGGTLTAGGVVTNGGTDCYVLANDDVIAMGDIMTKSSAGSAYVKSQSGLIKAVNVITDGFTDAYVQALPGSIVVRKDIRTKSSNGQAYVLTSFGKIAAYSITTNGSGDAYIQAPVLGLDVRGVIRATSSNGRASVYFGSAISTESVFIDAHEAADCGGQLFNVKDIVSAKSATGTAEIFGYSIKARSISSESPSLATVATGNGNIDVVGDIRTYSSSGDAYVLATNGNVSARSIKTIAAGDDGIGGSSGTSHFMLFPNTADTSLTVTNCELYLDSGRDWNMTLHCKGTCTLNGNGQELLFGDNGGIVVEQSSSLYLKNIILSNVSGTSIRCDDSNSTLSVDSVTFKLDGNFSINQGLWYFIGDCLVTGSGFIFEYADKELSLINKNSTLMFDDGVTLSYDSTTGDNRISMEDVTARLKFNGANLFGAEDIRFTKGTLVFDNSVTFSMAVGKKCYLGDFVSADNPTLDFILGSEFTMYDGPALIDQRV